MVLIDSFFFFFFFFFFFTPPARGHRDKFGERLSSFAFPFLHILTPISCSALLEVPHAVDVCVR